MNKSQQISSSSTVPESASTEELPTTAQAVRAMQETETSLEHAVKEAGVSQTGKVVAEKTEHLLKTSEKLLAEKSKNDEFQNLIKELNLAIQSANVSVPGDVYQMSSDVFDTLSEEMRVILHNLLHLSSLLVSSYQFRRFLSDSVLLARDFIDWLAKEAGETAQRVGAGATTGAVSAKERVEEAGQDIARKVAEKTGGISGELKLDFQSEQFRVLFKRFEKIVRQVQSSETWQHAVDDLLKALNRLWYDLSQITETVQQKGPESVAEETKQHIAKASQYARSIMENFAGGKSLTELYQRFNKAMNTIRADAELSEIMSRGNEFLRRVLKDPGYFASEEMKSDFQSLLDLLYKVKSPVWKSEIMAVLAESNTYFSAIRQDKLLNEFTSDWTDLMSSMFLDSQGNLTLKPELFYDVAKISRVVIEQVGLVAINEIHHSDESYDYSLRNIQLETPQQELLPGYSRVRFTAKVDQRHRTPIYLLEMKFSQIQAQAKNIQFEYNKKTMPKMSDKGLADIATRDEGFELHIDLIPDFNDQSTLFHVGRVEAVFNEFELNVHEAQHQILYSIISPLLRNRVKKVIEDNIEHKLMGYLTQFGKQLRSMLNYSNTIAQARLQDRRIIE